MFSKAPSISDVDRHSYPQSDNIRLLVPSHVALAGTANPELADRLLEKIEPGTVMMMGDNPSLVRMPEKPKLMDFFKYRFQRSVAQHLLQSAHLALKAGQAERVVIACLLHDISLATLIRCDHGYWGAQAIQPYVHPEVTWAVKYHQCLRYFPDASVGYHYPVSYKTLFGENFVPPSYLQRDYEVARNHRWYMSSRLITIYDIYAFDDSVCVEPEEFTDIIGRQFRDPVEGLGFDGSPASHMWRTMIWPNNFL